MADDCLFCKIAAGDVSADTVRESEEWIAFRDINPQAPTHILVIPRQHIATLNEAGPGEAEMLGRLLLAAKEIAAEEGIAEEGYRTVLNCNPGAGQSVFHIHLHVLGGRAMGWPPG
ncbi:MAG: histidine triad nucleotide-binding protein [Gemmatimonadetes bacterium]|uniref:Histidine triad nucleotide-binding protein n=1 Tax=Candidatus Kutchimonas denitrificans TaxID=3056748 RepID=A0AAE4ZAE2_9BACT|nr:histidine triad nucleotide-binding protein [Gemmatimonadota bacterium]NIR76553.1 histidine triad nucleotide-binding protein [Candidatus Kutchimonas denitrificans]NIS01109.1 histidine triad nucleotide-binding protein [Gemmatimonadota bacterium]NIT66876.1 histidine triad nucleotide-binding protein [Gemmatimonadota bacterium]NIU54649.1 HIT domain-containing protein [Gemmatimonadota bacterium]